MRCILRLGIGLRLCVRDDPVSRLSICRLGIEVGIGDSGLLGVVGAAVLKLRTENRDRSMDDWGRLVYLHRCTVSGREPGLRLLDHGADVVISVGVVTIVAHRLHLWHTTQVRIFFHILLGRVS